MSVHGMTHEELEAAEAEAYDKVRSVRAEMIAIRERIEPELARLYDEEIPHRREMAQFSMSSDYSPRQKKAREDFQRLEARRLHLISPLIPLQSRLHELTFSINQLSLWRGGLGTKLWAEGAVVASLATVGAPKTESHSRKIPDTVRSNDMLRIDDGRGHLFQFSKAEAQDYLNGHPLAFIAPSRRPVSMPAEPLTPSTKPSREEVDAAAAGLSESAQPSEAARQLPAASYSALIRINDGAGHLFSFDAEEAEAYLAANPSAFVAPPRGPSTPIQEPGPTHSELAASAAGI